MTTTQTQQREDAILAVAEDNDLDSVAFLAWCDNFHITDDYESQVDEYMDAYSGCWDTFQDFAENMFDDTMSVPDHLAPYIDYEKFARDLQYDYWTATDTTDYTVHVFRNI